MSAITRLTTACAAIMLTAARAIAGSFEVTSSTVDAGGGTSISSTYELAGTIGQPDAGPVLGSSSFEVVGGFWMGGPVDFCPEDLANNDGLVNVFDLLELLSNWGTDGPGANLDQPNDVVNVFDLLGLLSAWGACE